MNDSDQTQQERRRAELRFDALGFLLIFVPFILLMAFFLQYRLPAQIGLFPDTPFGRAASVAVFIVVAAVGSFVLLRLARIKQWLMRRARSRWQ